MLYQAVGVEEEAPALTALPSLTWCVSLQSQVTGLFLNHCLYLQVQRQHHVLLLLPVDVQVTAETSAAGPWLSAAASWPSWHLLWQLPFSVGLVSVPLEPSAQQLLHQLLHGLLQSLVGSWVPA